jgi:hypothetical protein
MTASADAPMDEALRWARVDWDRARREVRRLQRRRAKAVGGTVAQGASPAIPALTLVLRQATGGEAGELESGEENPRR